jgi:hypothetical protein
MPYKCAIPPSVKPLSTQEALVRELVPTAVPESPSALPAEMPPAEVVPVRTNKSMTAPLSLMSIACMSDPDHRPLAPLVPFATSCPARL